MPLYALKCSCGHGFEEFSKTREPRALPCPKCGATNCEPDFGKCRIVTERQFAGSECESIREGFHPDEVEEARRTFPDTTIRDDGTVMWSKRSDITKFNKRREQLQRENQQRREETQTVAGAGPEAGFTFD